MLNISKGLAVTLVSNLGYRKLSSRFVPKILSPEMKEARLACAKENLALLEQFGTTFLDNIVTEDETVLSKYHPECKRDSSEWRRRDEKPPIKLRCGTSHKREFLLSVFWSRRNVISCDFLEKEKTCNATHFSELVRECKSLRRKSPGVPLWLLIDKAPIHKAGVSQQAIVSIVWFCAIVPSTVITRRCTE